MKTLFGKWHIALSLGALVLASGLTGCGMMKDEPEDCAHAPATSVRVKFMYDYTMAGANVFAQEVGGVTLYVFDSEGTLVTSKEAKNSFEWQLRGADFAMDLTDELIHRPGTYTMYALAVGNNKGYDASLLTPGPKFTRTAMTDGVSTPADMQMALSRTNGVVPLQPLARDPKATRIDTTWVTLQPQQLVIPELNFNPVAYDEQPADFHAEATVPLMRVTNHLECIFWLSDFPDALRPQDFTITIKKAHNGNLGITGTPAAGSEALTYQPNYLWTDNYKGPDGITRPAIHAIFGLSRLMLDGTEEIQVEKHLILGSAPTIVRMVPQLLANGREAYTSKNYTEQQYLDREHNYCLAFSVDDTYPKFVDVNVNILSWAKRIQMADL